jgi:hypothetical protein
METEQQQRFNEPMERKSRDAEAATHATQRRGQEVTADEWNQ